MMRNPFSQKGLNFVLPPKKLKYQDYLLPYELIYRDVMNVDEVKDTLVYLKSRLKEVGLSSFRLFNKKVHRFENLARDKYEAFSDLRVIIPSLSRKQTKGIRLLLLTKLHMFNKWKSY